VVGLPEAQLDGRGACGPCVILRDDTQQERLEGPTAELWPRLDANQKESTSGTLQGRVHLLLMRPWRDRHGLQGLVFEQHPRRKGLPGRSWLRVGERG